jgi:hypothetical protein
VLQTDTHVKTSLALSVFVAVVLYARDSELLYRVSLMIHVSQYWRRKPQTMPNGG